MRIFASLIACAVLLGGAGHAKDCTSYRVTLCACAQAPACTADAAYAIRKDGTDDYLPLPRLEIATTPAERARGLMGRAPLANDQAMLFVYPDEAPRAFWMKGTPSPLDIIFINAAGLIVSVAASAVPFDETPLPSAAPARYVLEVAAGRAEALGLRAGDRLKLEPGGERF